MDFRFDLLPSLRILDARFPEEIGRHPYLSSLQLQTESPAITCEDKHKILNVLSQLLVSSPVLTAPIAQLFRPILLELVARVTDTGPRSVLGEWEVQRFEATASALSKLLHMAPHTSGMVLAFFARSPSLFERLSQPRAADSTHVDDSFVELAKTAYRFLKFSSTDFGTSLWDWSPFFSLLSIEHNAALRFYVLESVSILLSISDENKLKLPNALDLQHIKAMCEIRVHETQEMALEQALMFTSTWDAASTTTSSDSATSHRHVINIIMHRRLFPKELSSNHPYACRDHSVVTSQDLHSSLVSVCGVLLPRRRINDKGDEAKRDNMLNESLVYTATTLLNMKSLALAVCEGDPILLEGNTGAGKTALIEEIARLTGNQDIIKIHLGDQTDAKVLLGTYVCTEVPGEFRWQAGALTQAVREGRWIVIEDIDLAPLEILSVLIPLLETRKLFIPGRGEVIYAPKNFQLFATQTLYGSSGGSVGQNARLLHNFWTRVVVESLSSEELGTILASKYPQIATLVPQFIATFDLLRGNTESTLLLQQSESAGSSATTPIVLSTDYMVNSIFSGRHLSTRDLLKWCRRVNRHFQSLAQQGVTNIIVTYQLKELIYLEAIDCFCAMVPSLANREKCYALIGQSLGVPADRIQHFVQLYKPSIDLSPTAFTVGRATLPKAPAQELLTAPRKSKFAHTKQSLTLLERLAHCLGMGEPALLVGETGTGKTSVVQYLADQLDQKLVVQNLSQQTDSSDLLGGFKPVEMRILCIPLKAKFDQLFPKTFSKKANAKFIADVDQAFGQQDWKKFILLLTKSLQEVEKKFLLLDQKEDAQRKKSSDGTKPTAAKPEKKAAAAKQASSAEVKGKRKAEAELSKEGASAEAKKPKQAARRKKQAQKPVSPLVRQEWKKLAAAVSKFEIQQDQLKNNFAFAFVEGTLVEAVQKGYWVLLDEVNLATPETLESISSLLEGGSIVLTEKGDVEPIKRHPNFRVFACMNPPTDIGKKNLPPGLRNRFTEFYVDELSNVEDLRTVVHSYIKGCVAQPPVDDIVNLYLAARQQSQIDLTDGANQRPHYSLRTLCRALEYALLIQPDYGFKRALYEGFSMSFLTQLNTASVPTMLALIRKYLVKGMNDNQLLMPPKKPEVAAEQDFVLFEQFWIAVGNQPVVDPTHYILTASIKKHLANLARAVLSRKYPVLLQGPTSSGKTSMVEYLARRTGHRFVRINNHEHTDLQEYLGTYISDPNGKLVFQEGILVEAVRKGYWVVLDELNLAPSEVLEALNRLLDDNHELFIPETQEVVKPHPHFMLFATQNPPGLYGGRKVLSRAFRNRFVELHVDDIPDSELKIILEKRCSMAPPYCEKLVAVLKDLQRRRQGTQVFAGKHGFITLRDLFRWAERRPNGYQQLAEEGYMLLAERLRKPEEKRVIKEVLEKNMKNVVINEDEIYSRPFKADSVENDLFESLRMAEGFGSMVWNQSMRRLFSLVGRCLRHKEPVLLVGETGCGKTSICQYFASLLSQRLHILNCHQHTETADFLGGLRPVRGKEQIRAQLVAKLKVFFEHALQLREALDEELIGHVETVMAGLNTFTINDMAVLLERVWHAMTQHASSRDDEVALPHAEVEEIDSLHKKYKALFAWYDGPLVQAMKRGDLFLIDEISLAEDSVLERLNSVLEPNRLLVLAEKGATEIEELIAHSDFRILATMNPGGDFGKKELSPAMRNRFTEIWVPPITSHHDLSLIVKERFVPPLVEFYSPVIDFVLWFRSNLLTSQKRTISLRDILSWVTFMNAVHATMPTLNMWESYLHSACLVLLDGLSYGPSSRLRVASSSSSSSSSSSQPSTAVVGVDQNARMKKQCFEFLLAQLPAEERTRFDEHVFLTQGIIQRYDKQQQQQDDAGHEDGIESGGRFGLPRCPFTINKGAHAVPAKLDFALQAPTTAKNVMRVLRGLQLHKPILLEGSPGVGKTSLCMAIAKASGHKVVRINLSEQTDMMDLLGSDLPVEGGTGGEFAWCDGIFLQALKNGDWVLLDELNLASQSVLEGLNSVLDHRATVYIPELQRSFDCPSSFRIFACQNPVAQGGGRKGLPKSFLNRFTQVYVDELTGDDLLFITKSMFPRIPESVLEKMIAFNDRLFHDTMVLGHYGKKGSPWEFNLRDISRWCSLMIDHQSDATWDPSQFVDLIYIQRMRTHTDREQVTRLYNRVFKPASPFRPQLHPYFHVTPAHVQIGDAWLPRNRSTTTGDDGVVLESPHILQGALNALENMMKCVDKGWMAILSGPAASGKTSLVRLLANLTGNRLREFSMNSSIDTTELLGGFEQIDLQRHKRGILANVSSLLNKVSELLLVEEAKFTSNSLGVLRDIHSTWALLKTKTRFIGQTDSASLAPDAAAAHHAFDEEQYSLMRQLLEKVHSLGHERGWDWSDMGAGVLSPLSISAAIQRLKSVEKSSVAGCFEWMDGLLINALEEGDWILVDNVNFCNPTVLDRLNPLLENNGVLMVNERGLVNGEVKVITPHPNFRIFLAMDPHNGEISRAMRNRGIEISLLPLDAASFDTLALLNGIGVPGAWLARLMTEFHRALQREKQIFYSAEHSLTIRDLLHWASLTVEQVQRGAPLSSALREAMELVYLRNLKSREKQNVVRAIFGQHFSLLLHSLAHGQWKELMTVQDQTPSNEPGGQASAEKTSFLAPALWPFFVSGTDYRDNSTEATIVRQSALFLHYILQTGGHDLKEEASRELGSDFEAVLLEASTATTTDAGQTTAMRAKVAASGPQVRCSLPLPILQRLFAFYDQKQPNGDGRESDAVLPYLPPKPSAQGQAEAEAAMVKDQQAMVQRSDEEIGFAAAYVLENSSPHDYHHRVSYFRSLGGERGAIFAEAVEQLWVHPLVAEVMKSRERLIECCFRDVADPAVREGKRAEVRGLLAFQPLDVRANAPLLSKLWNYLHFQSSDDDIAAEARQQLAEEREQAWGHHLNLLHRLNALIAFISHKRKEEKDLGAGAAQAGSPIRLSYLFYHHKLEKSQLPHGVIALFWPFFALLDEGIESHFVSASDVDVSALEGLIKQRNYFWDYLSSAAASTLNLADLQLHWKFVFKHLRQLEHQQQPAASEDHAVVIASSCDDDVNYYLKQRSGVAFQPASGLVSLTEKIVDMLAAALAGQASDVAPAARKGKSAGRDTLWKRGGHPSLLRSSQLFALENQLYGLLTPFNADPTLRKRGGSDVDDKSGGPVVKANRTDRYAHWKEGIHPLYFRLDEDFKRVFVEGAATLHWLDSSAALDAAEANKSSAVFDSIAQVPQLLDARLTALEARWERERQEEEVTEAAMLEGERRLDARQRGLHKIWAQLWPLLDHFSSRQELVLLAKLTGLLESAADESQVRAGLEGLLPWVRSFVERGLGRTSRSPEDFVPYQRLLWKYSSRAVDDNNKAQDERQVDNNGNNKKRLSAASSAREELVELVQEMKYRYHARLWHNTFNDMSFLSPPPPPAPANTGAAAVALERQIVEVGKDSMGPPRLFQSIQSAFVLHLFADWRKSVSVDQHPQRVKQLHSLSSLFRQSYVSDLKRADWGILFSTFVYILDSFRDTFAEEVFATLRDTTMQLGAALLPPKDDDDEGEGESVLRGASPSFVKAERVDREAFAALLDRSSDARFCAKIATHLLPIVDVFLRKVESTREEGQRLTDEEESAMRGKLYVLLGLVQLQLLLPAQKVDPAAKYPAKLAQVERAADSLSCEIGVRAQIEKLFTGREGNEKIDALRLDVERHQLHAASLARKVTIRPEASKFGALFDALHQFARTLEGGGDGSAYSMMRFFCGEDATTTAKKSARSKRRKSKKQEDDEAAAASDAKARKLEMLLDKEELWQEKAHNFIAALREKYAPHYNDILHPMFLSLHHVMFGLRLLRFAAPVILAGPSADAAAAKRVLGGLVGDLASFPAVENMSIKVSAVDRIADVIAPPVIQSLLDERGEGKLPHYLRGIPSMVLRSALCRAYLHIRSARFMSRSALALLDHVFTTFSDMWKRMKEREKEAKAKEEEFYKTRGKVRRHVIKDADQEEEDDLEDMFPSFWNDYDDLVPLEERELLNVEQAPAGADADAASAAESDGLENEDIQEWEVHQIYSVHRYIHQHVTTSSRTAAAAAKATAAAAANSVAGTKKRRQVRRKNVKNTKKDEYLTVNEEAIRDTHDELKTEDLVDVLELSYSAGAAVMRVLDHDAAPELDEKALGGHLVMMHQILRSLTERPEGKGLLIKKETKRRNTQPGNKDKGEKTEREHLLSESAMVSAVNEHRSIIQAGGMVHDIYRDPNIPEVLLAREPLEELSQRLLELLVEFEGNALLEQLLKITRRVLSFPITSPLMKVLTGLEFLHGKTNDWESNAAKRVSLYAHMEKIGRLIGRWRRLELQSYPLIFYSRLQSHQTAAEKWWFHLYSLLKYSDLGIEKADDAAAKAAVDEDLRLLAEAEAEQQRERQGHWADKKQRKQHQWVKPAEATDVILETLDGFMLSATHGEFSTRLQLLHTFHEHTAYELRARFEREGAPLQTREHVRNLLYNLHRYYAQFLGKVEDHMKRMREPLEKKVRDFIQLAKWDDLNYYSLKTSSEKSHRTLNKHSRHLEDLLRQPVNALLEKPDDEEEDIAAAAAAAEGAEPAESTLYVFEGDESATFLQKGIDAGVPVAERTDADFASPVLREAFDLDNPKRKQNRLPALYGRMTKICERDILYCDEGRRTPPQPPKPVEKKKKKQNKKNDKKNKGKDGGGDDEKREEETPSVVEEDQDDEEEEEEAMSWKEEEIRELEWFKERVAANSVALRSKEKPRTQKMHMIRQLLQSFQSRGLSHLSTAYNLKQKGLPYLLSLPSMEAVEQTFTVGDKARMWVSANEQYYRCVRRMRHLREASTMPSKELNQREVQRMSGYAEHLFHLIITEREALAQATSHIRSLGAFNSLLATIHERSKYQSVAAAADPMPPQKDALQWARKQKRIAAQLTMTLAQAAILCDALKSPLGSVQRVNRQLELARKVETDLLLQFAWHPEPQSLLGADDEEIDEEQNKHVLVSSETWAVVVANYVQLQNVANVTAETLLDESSLFPVPLAHSICAFLREVAEAASQFRRWLRDTHHQAKGELNEPESEHEKRFGAAFSEKMEAAINSLLVAVQNVQKVQKTADPFVQRKQKAENNNKKSEDDDKNEEKDENDKEKKSEDEEEEEEEEERRKCNFLQFHNYLRDLKEGLNMKNVRDNIEAVIALVAAECAGRVQSADADSASVSSTDASLALSTAVQKDRVALALLAQFYPLVAQYHSLVDWYVRRLLGFHSSLARTHHQVSGLFLTLLTRGYCNPEEEAEGGGGEGDMKLQDDIQGTGMGDGTGKKDVSDEIDNEDQLMGTNKEEKEENKEPAPENDDEEKGFEMQQDFDGEIEDMPDKGDEQEEDEDKEEEDEEEEEMDREMGEIDSEDEEVVDEKMWGSEDEEEDNTRQDGKEKIDRDNTVDADPEGEEEMVAKEDNDGTDDKDDGDKKDDDKKKKKKEEKGKEDDEGERGDEEDDEEDEEEKGKKKEEQEQEDDDEGDVNDMEDIYEDKGKDVRQEEEFELPDDLELDGNDKKDQEEEGGMDEEEEEEEKEEDKKKDDDDDVMDIADDDDEMKEGEGEAKDEEEGTKEDEEDKKPDEDQEKKDDNEGEERQDDDDDEKEKDDKEKELDAEGEDEKQAGMGGQEAKENEEEEKKEEEEEEEAEKSNAQEINAEDKEEVANTETQPQGVMHETIRKSANVQMEDQQDQPRPQDDLNQADENAQEAMSSDMDERSQRWIKSMKNPPQPEREDKKKQEKKKRERVDPNPYRSEGDATKEWKERLRVMDKLTEEEEKKDGEEDDQMDLDHDEEEDKEEAEMYEFMKEDDRDKEDAQTLAPADETQAKSIPQKEDDKKQKDGENGDEEEKNEDEEEEEKNEEEEEEEREKGEGDEEKEKERERVKEMRALRMAKDQRRGKNGEEEETPEDDVEDLTKDDDAQADADDADAERRDDGSSHHSMPQLLNEEEEQPKKAAEAEEVVLLTPEAMAAKREELDREMAEWREKGDMVHAEKLWRGYEALTAPLAQDLCEQLRLILEPTLCTQMRGDYRTGKRLNMKKVIPYIASQFKKDKIWMRRTKPSKRTYQVMLAIDDSRSMFENRAGHMACQALTLMAKALAQLEVGQLAILRFGETSDVLHPFDTPFTDQSGVDIISHFTFKQENTNVVRLMESVVSTFDLERHSAAGGGRDGDHMQLLFVVSDGRFGTRGKDVKRWIREALKRNVFIVFIITDAARPNAINLATQPHPNAEVDDDEAEVRAKRAKRAAAREAAGGSPAATAAVRNDSSILELQTITINREGKPVRSSYMDTFPFPNYIVLQDINALPSILADALRQWFELIQQKFSA